MRALRPIGMKKVIILMSVVFLSYALVGQIIAKDIADSYKKQMIAHDAAVAGHLNQQGYEKNQIAAAFSAEKTEADRLEGHSILLRTGYTQHLDNRLLPEVQHIERKYAVMFFLLFLVLFILLFTIFATYSLRQHRRLEEAQSVMADFLNGNTAIRLDDQDEGSLAKLFTSINVMATSLTSHFEKEKRNKEFLRDLISDISHQLKTPLAALMMYNEIIQEEKTDSVVITEFIRKSENELKRIESLIQNLLKLAKMDAGMIELEKKPQELKSFLDKCIQSFQTRSELEQKQITVDCTDASVLNVDEGWLLEAVSNIIKNALDHTKAEDTIQISCEETPVITRIMIKDTGSGVYPEDIHHIFKRFYRSRYSKDKQGIGIGLTLAKAIIEKHGGTVWAESELGKGTTFFLTFPKFD